MNPNFVKSYHVYFKKHMYFTLYVQCCVEIRSLQRVEAFSCHIFHVFENDTLLNALPPFYHLGEALPTYCPFTATFRQHNATLARSFHPYNKEDAFCLRGLYVPSATCVHLDSHPSSLQIV